MDTTMQTGVWYRQ